MAQSCDYHRRSTAEWHCASCAKDFCRGCIPGAAANYHNGQPECPLCRKPLEYTGACNNARPFWQMGPFFFRYALQPGPLTVVALSALASLLISGLNLLSLAMLVGAMALVTRYNLLVIETLARGRMKAPALGEALDGRSAVLFLKVIAMMLVAGFVGYKLIPLGERALQLYSIALSLLAPAAMIILAVEGSLRAAINPLKLFYFTVVIGWPYWLLWLTTGAVSSAPGYLILAIGDELPRWAIMPVIAASTGYFYIVTSAMMGYICLTRQRQLGISPDPEDDAELMDEAEFERARTLAETHILLSEGDYSGARQALVQTLRRYSEDPALNERYYRLLLAQRDTGALRELAPHLLEKFVRLDRAYKAAELYMATDPVPVIDNSRLRHALADALYRQQKFRPAAQLLNNLHRDDPAYGALDAAYLLLARVYIDGFNREDTARKLLSFLRKNFPDSQLRDEISTLQGILAG
ncbi:hypothetical protein [Microbulbifer sp. YPW16]|uniref:hypothetical protein n=1 Tax=Microbulbifer sp. YPW16 TaxID=2904242 RepID=UPI001E481918|nr:hypothetical protein [Microbulbifer sp. YPW16]UHQ54371.1 hypothetical protein LVE68_12695 [Microbulbifer sp. YPW16]